MVRVPLRGAGSSAKLVKDLRHLIRSARFGVFQAVNSALVMHYWQVGQRIRGNILDSRRAAYGEQIVSTLSRQLSVEFGSGYSRPNLFRMIKFAESFPDGEIVSTLSRQLSWSHFIEILRWLEKHEMEPGEAAPIGLILCADKGDERVELLQLDKSGIRVASYLTDLPPKRLLQKKLHQTMIAARARLESEQSSETGSESRSRT